MVREELIRGLTDRFCAHFADEVAAWVCDVGAVGLLYTLNAE